MRMIGKRWRGFGRSRRWKVRKEPWVCEWDTLWYAFFGGYASTDKVESMPGIYKRGC